MNKQIILMQSLHLSHLLNNQAFQTIRITTSINSMFSRFLSLFLSNLIAKALCLFTSLLTAPELETIAVDDELLELMPICWSKYLITRFLNPTNRLNATYPCPNSNTSSREIDNFGNVIPWDLCILKLQANLKGNCVRLATTLSWIVFSHLAGSTIAIRSLESSSSSSSIPGLIPWN